MPRLTDVSTMERLIATDSLGDMIKYSFALYIFFCLIIWIDIVSYKKHFLKKTFHVVGNLKKFVLRDKRPIPALWKQHIWNTWLISSACYATMGIYLILTDSVYKGAAIAIVGITAVLIFIIPWKKCKTKFSRLKGELGIELERYEDTGKPLIEQPFWRRRYWRNRHVFAKFVVICSIISILYFIQGNMFMGVVIAIFAAYEIIEFKKYR